MANQWVLVPVEPTEAMTQAAMDALDSPFYADLEAAYRAMIGAAPETPAASNPQSACAGEEAGQAAEEANRASAAASPSPEALPASGVEARERIEALIRMCGTARDNLTQGNISAEGMLPAIVGGLGSIEHVARQALAALTAAPAPEDR